MIKKKSVFFFTAKVLYNQKVPDSSHWKHMAISLS